ncbi:MAG: zinc ribbon domain-containing protein [Syntrophomonadaceae bacterium]|nr:zinc ribbon domain-containing protein [Syntrophomonadaceae bacterium]
MPIFDFICQKCGYKFDIKISNAEKNKVRCPECDSSDLKQILSLFNAGSSKSSYFAPGCSGNMNKCGG